MKLTGTCVVVTGAAGGIGAALARRFATERPRGIVVSDRDEAGIRAVAREIGAGEMDALAVPCDVTQEAEQAKRSGIDGVPCFIFGGVLAVSGAQDPAYLADAMARAVDEVEKRASAATAAE